MDLLSLIRRQLNARGARIVGTQLNTNVEVLKKKFQDEGKTFPANIDASSQTVISFTVKIADLIKDDVTMGEVDNRTDSVIAAFKAFLEALLRLFQQVPYLEMPDASAERLEDIKTLYNTSYPDGKLDYLQTPHRTQWTYLEDLEKALRAQEIKDLIDKLGFRSEIDRVFQWINLYGGRLGLTQEAKDLVEKIKALLDSWHRAWALHMAQVFTTFPDENNLEHLSMRDALLSPYDQQVEEVRKEERRQEERREKVARKKAEEGRKKVEEAKKVVEEAEKAEEQKEEKAKE